MSFNDFFLCQMSSGGCLNEPPFSSLRGCDVGPAANLNSGSDSFLYSEGFHDSSDIFALCIATAAPDKSGHLMAGLFFDLHAQTLTLDCVSVDVGRDGCPDRATNLLGNTRQHKKSFWLPCYTDSAHIEQCSGEGAFSKAFSPY